MGEVVLLHPPLPPPAPAARPALGPSLLLTMAIFSVLSREQRIAVAADIWQIQQEKPDCDVSRQTKWLVDNLMLEHA